MSVLPEHESWNFRYRVHAAVVRTSCATVYGILVHLIGAVIGHAVFRVADGQVGGVQPAVALNEPHAVCRPAAKPVVLDKVLIIAHALGILLQLVVEQGFGEHIAVGTPDIAPVVLPRLDGVGGKVKVVLRPRADKARDVDLVVVVGAVLDIPRVGVVTAVIRLIGLEPVGVLVHGVALKQGLIEGPSPGLGVLLEAQILHQLLRVDPFHLHFHRGHAPILAAVYKPQRRGYGQTGGTEVPDGLGAHGIEVLLVGHGVDSDEPEQVVHIHGIVHLDPVYGCPIRLILRGKTGDDGVHLRFFKVLQAHIGPADGQRLLGHVHDHLRV